MKRSYRTHRSEADWRNIIDQQAASNLPVRTFCKQQGIGDQSFYHWRKRLETQSTPASLNMVDITRMVSIDSSTRWHIELDLGGGIKLNLTQA